MSFFDYLKNRLTQKLPGLIAQMEMAPKPPNSQRKYRSSPNDNAIESSVMILLSPGKLNRPEVVLTLRTETISHAGQISFPGGRLENGESPKEAALREMREEIGVAEDLPEIAGKISDLYLQHSNNLIKPFVGYLHKKPIININPAEVQEAFFVPLDEFLNKQNLVIEAWELNEEVYRVPYWNFHNVPLWGATAMMMSELLQLYRDFLDNN